MAAAVADFSVVDVGGLRHLVGVSFVGKDSFVAGIDE